MSTLEHDNWVLHPGPEFEYWGEVHPESPILDEIFSSSSLGWSFSVLCRIWILVAFLSLRSFVSKSLPFRELANIFFHSYLSVMASSQQWRLWRSITVPGDVLPWRTGNYWCPGDAWDVDDTLQNGVLPLLQIICPQKPIMWRLRSFGLGQYF